MLGSTVDTYSASARGWLLGDFHILLREWVVSTPVVDSRPVLLRSGRALRRQRSGMYCTDFAGIFAPRAVFPTIAHGDGEVCTVDASPAEQFFLGNLDNISLSPLYFAPSARCARCLFWGALGSTLLPSSLFR